jgi:hypothetical protein
MEARAVLAGPGALRALRTGGEGRLEIAHGGGGYVRLGDDGWLLVTGERAEVGPLSLLIAGLGHRRSEAGWLAHAERGTFTLGPHRVGFTGVRVAGCPASRPRRGDVDAALAAALARLPVWPAALAGGLAALEAGDGRLAVELLAGRGHGLTPAGDDVLAGYAGWQSAAGRPTTLSNLAAVRASPIGLAYLRCAERGELPEPAAATLAAIGAGDVAAARRRAGMLGQWGASSGAALLWGMAAARRGERGCGLGGATSARQMPLAGRHDQAELVASHEQVVGPDRRDPNAAAAAKR